jgi:hypothetical protein
MSEYLGHKRQRAVSYLNVLNSCRTKCQRRTGAALVPDPCDPQKSTYLKPDDPQILEVTQESWPVVNCYFELIVVHLILLTQ